MGIIEVFFIGVGLSMDAFAVSVCKGLSMKSVNYRHALLIALFFGVFQGGMPVLGWAIAGQFWEYIEGFDHWLAFILLAFIGSKMLYDALRGSGEEASCDEADDRFDFKETTVLAIATSIDALAVGIMFGSLQIDVAPAATVIGVTTFVFSLAGVVIGNKFGARFERPATIVGGIILLFIGFKIVLEHLGLITG